MIITEQNKIYLSAQLLFDHCVGSILKQGERCFEDDNCVYRSGDLRCVVGFAIPDKDYHPRMEGRNIREIIEHGELYYLEPFQDLLMDLQDVHDGNDIDDWHEEFAKVAHNYNLEWNF